ncbi:hypothetical protein JOB18_002033 [Solea senegalensis]|uniref:Uncharacterized protein n=1 Tax=Solea senegalensis TaxID=28829 RepID=A0AAV6QYQ6_SOLSE|nr:hypothetical protein JOB18_002033 [Solea senegalensis]
MMRSQNSAPTRVPVSEILRSNARSGQIFSPPVSSKSANNRSAGDISRLRSASFLQTYKTVAVYGLRVARIALRKVHPTEFVNNTCEKLIILCHTAARTSNDADLVL